MCGAWASAQRNAASLTLRPLRLNRPPLPIRSTMPPCATGEALCTDIGLHPFRFLREILFNGNRLVQGPTILRVGRSTIRTHGDLRDGGDVRRHVRWPRRAPRRPGRIG